MRARTRPTVCRGLTKRSLCAALCVAVAVAVNGAIAWLLIELNEYSLPERPPRGAVVFQPPPEPSDPPKPTERAKETTEPEKNPERKPTQTPTKASLDLPRPAPAAPEPAPVPLEVSAATISPVRAATPVTTPPQPQRKAASETSRAPDGPVAGDKLDEELKRLREPMDYPVAARRRGAEGSVTVRMLIGTEGRVRQAKVVHVTGHESFRRAVTDSIYQWRFTKPTRNGKPVKARIEITINFRLR